MSREQGYLNRSTSSASLWLLSGCPRISQGAASRFPCVNLKGYSLLWNNFVAFYLTRVFWGQSLSTLSDQMRSSRLPRRCTLLFSGHVLAKWLLPAHCWHCFPHDGQHSCFRTWCCPQNFDVLHCFRYDGGPAIGLLPLFLAGLLLWEVFGGYGVLFTDSVYYSLLLPATDCRFKGQFSFFQECILGVSVSNCHHNSVTQKGCYVYNVCDGRLKKTG